MSGEASPDYHPELKTFRGAKGFPKVCFFFYVFLRQFISDVETSIKTRISVISNVV